MPPQHLSTISNTHAWRHGDAPYANVGDQDIPRDYVVFSVVATETTSVGEGEAETVRKEIWKLVDLEDFGVSWVAGGGALEWRRQQYRDLGRTADVGRIVGAQIASPGNTVSP